MFHSFSKKFLYVQPSISKKFSHFSTRTGRKAGKGGGGGGEGGRVGEVHTDHYGCTSYSVVYHRMIT